MAKFSSLLLKKRLLPTIRGFLCLFLLQACAASSFFNFDLASVNLDPLTNGITIPGGGYFGHSMNKAGDVNGDGYDDIIIGAPYSSSNKGVAYVIYGRETSSLPDLTLSLDPKTTGFYITGRSAGDYFGWSVSGAGDINKDGYDDIIIGATGYDTYRGLVYVVYGGNKLSLANLDLSTVNLDPGTTGFTIRGGSLGDQLGWSVSTAGDIDQDGYDDMVMSAQTVGSNYGAAYVIYGGEKYTRAHIDLSSYSTLNPATTGFRISGAEYDYLGNLVNTVGDIDKDGYPDIVITTDSIGRIYVIYGGERSNLQHLSLYSATALNPATTGFTISVGGTGLVAARAGDIDKDGFDDILIGAPAVGYNQAWIFYGKERSSLSHIDSNSPLNPATFGFKIIGGAYQDYFGCSLSTAGDINKDGYDDFMIGAYGKNTRKGAVYVIYGGDRSTRSSINLSSQTLDPGVNGFIIEGNAAEDRFGWAMSTAGDFNKDGEIDIMISAAYKGYYGGYVYVIHSICSDCVRCPANCDECSNSTTCTKCASSYLLSEAQCVKTCPNATFSKNGVCEDCSSHCLSCTSKISCQTCEDGYKLSNSLCASPSDPTSPTSPGSPNSPNSPTSDSISSDQTQEKAHQAIASSAKGIGSLVCVGSATFPLTAMVSKIVQNTRYLNLSVTSELAQIYQTWDTDLISWEVPNIISDLDEYKTSPAVFDRYGLNSSFLTNFWPTLITMGAGFAAFALCLAVQKLLQQAKYEGWISSLVGKLVIGCFNFGLVQAYGCLDDILFYLVLDIKTNIWSGFYSWASVICAGIFMALGCLLVFFNYWTVKKYQAIKSQGPAKRVAKDLEAFNERNQYWELFYSDFNDEDLLSQSFFAFLVVRSSLSSFIVAVLYDYPLMQTVYLVILDGVIILFLIFKKPLTTLEATLCQYYFEIITLLVHLCTFILGLQDTFKTSSETLRSVLSTGIIYLNTALVSGSIGFMFVEICKTIRHRVKDKTVSVEQPPEEIESIITNSPIKESGESLSKQVISFENNDTSFIGLNHHYLESSANMNADNSIGSDMNGSILPTVVRNRPLRALKQRQQRNKSLRPKNSRNPR